MLYRACGCAVLHCGCAEVPFLIECVSSSHVPERRAFLPAPSRDFVSVVYFISLRGHVQQLFELREDGLHPLAAMYGGKAHDIAPCMAVKIVVRFEVFRDPAIKKAKASVAKKGGFRNRKPKWVRKDALRAMLPLLKETRPGVEDLTRALCFSCSATPFYCGCRPKPARRNTHAAAIVLCRLKTKKSF